MSQVSKVRPHSNMSRSTITQYRINHGKRKGNSIPTSVLELYLLTVVMMIMKEMLVTVTSGCVYYSILSSISSMTSSCDLFVVVLSYRYSPVKPTTVQNAYENRSDGINLVVNVQSLTTQLQETAVHYCNSPKNTLSIFRIENTLPKRPFQVSYV